MVFNEQEMYKIISSKGVIQWMIGCSFLTIISNIPYFFASLSFFTIVASVVILGIYAAPIVLMYYARKKKSIVAAGYACSLFMMLSIPYFFSFTNFMIELENYRPFEMACLVVTALLYLNCYYPHKDFSAVITSQEPLVIDTDNVSKYISKSFLFSVYPITLLFIVAIAALVSRIFLYESLTAMLVLALSVGLATPFIL